MIIFNVWIIIVQQTPEMISAVDERFVPENHDDQQEVAVCPDCGWMKKYATFSQSRQALGAHRRFCISPFAKPLKRP